MSNVVNLNESNFEGEVLKHGGIVAVGFYSAGTPSQGTMVQTLSAMATKAAGKIKVGQVDIAAAPQLAKQYGVDSVPKVMVFHAGEPK